MDAGPDPDPDGTRPGDGNADAEGPTAPERDVTFAVLGDPDEGPTLQLDHERFAYAGKFVMSATGKAVAREAGSDGGSDGVEGGDGAEVSDDAEEGGASDPGGDREVVERDGAVIGAASFDRDRTDPAVARIRYVTVRRDRRGEGIGPRLLAFLAERLLADGAVLDDVREVRIAVNNAFAYEAAFKAGFGSTGERTGLAELLCARPGDRSPVAYRRGFEAFLARDDVDTGERAFVEERLDAGPPTPVEAPGAEPGGGEG